MTRLLEVFFFFKGKKEMQELEHSAERSAVIWGHPSGFQGVRTCSQRRAVGRAERWAEPSWDSLPGRPVQAERQTGRTSLR